MNKVEINGIYYNLNEGEKTAEVTKNPNKYSGAVSIPETVTYNGITYSVTSIGNYAFCGCSGLTSVNIPDSVTSIGGGSILGMLRTHIRQHTKLRNKHRTQRIQWLLRTHICQHT